MNGPIKRLAGPVLILALILSVSSQLQASSGDHIQRDIEARFAENRTLRDARIMVHVEQGLVVLTGQVRFYEHKLVSERIAWTTPGVLEVDNEIRVTPIVPASDGAIERKIWEIVKNHARFHGAELVVAVDAGTVSIQGSFSGITDPSFLKHRVAEIEGVVDINMNAAFLALL